MIITLPRPPSVNGLFVNAGKFRVKSPAYRMWIEDAGKHLMIQRPKKLLGPVTVSIAVEDIGPGDLDNLAKSLLDLMVRHTVIEDDRREIVRAINMKWADIAGVMVEITAVPSA